MAYPKITWIDQNGEQQALLMQLPPTKRPLAWLERIGEDSISTAGVRQSMTQRVDEFLELNFEWIEKGEDGDQWVAFMRWALLYNDTFEFYEDADVDVHDTYSLADTTFKPAFQNKSYAFKMKLRKEVA